jgi:hypothetical protein
MPENDDSDIPEVSDDAISNMKNDASAHAKIAKGLDVITSEATKVFPDIQPFRFSLRHATEQERRAQFYFQLQPSEVVQLQENGSPQIYPDSPETVINLCFPPMKQEQIVSKGYHVEEILVLSGHPHPTFRYKVVPMTEHNIPGIGTLNMLLRSASRFSNEITIIGEAEVGEVSLGLDHGVYIKILEAGRIPRALNTPTIVLDFPSNSDAKTLLEKTMGTYALLFEKERKDTLSPHIGTVVAPARVGHFAFDEEEAENFESQVLDEYRKYTAQNHIKACGGDSSFADIPTCSLRAFSQLYNLAPLDNSLFNGSYALIGVTTADDNEEDPTFRYSVQPFAQHDIQPDTLTKLFTDYLDTTDHSLDFEFDDSDNSLTITIDERLDITVLEYGTLPTTGSLCAPIFTFQNTPEDVELVHKLTKEYRTRVNELLQTNSFLD